MKFGYYPGCSLSGTAKEFDLSLKETLSVLNTNLEEISDWSCCGASSAHISSHLLAVALPARNLIIARKQGLNDLVAPCAACYNRLVTTQHELKLDEKIRVKSEEILEEKYKDGLEICNLIQLFQKIGIERIKELKKINLNDLKAACYYGCLLLRPADITHFDDKEDPSSMEEIVKAAGAKTVDWNFKTECCGASHSIPHVEIVEKLGKAILDNAIKNGADIIVTACPMCHANLDMRQKNIIKHNPEQKSIPVLYLTQLLGIAFGIEYKKLGLNRHTIDPVPLLKEKTKKFAEAAA
ncbi:MAG TPA: CoB--CoM heterodisulfide reductase iron-sulfur subunit B family protein [Ignavibacteriaceae bacterium]|nr:CoB--CoM heterodisulfide reductase iron-sulfur subunit B family protein [Ignavibacteriaceae bacterium]